MDNNKLNNLLQLIDTTVQQNYAVDVWLPSLATNTTESVKFKPITVMQQKSLISTSLNEDLQNTEFCKSFYKIINDNYVESSNFNKNNLNILDKILIALALRANTGNILTIEKHNVNLSDLIHQFKIEIINNINLFNSQVFTYQDNISIKCKIPSIALEFESESLNVPLTTKDAESQLSSIIINTVATEIAKYVDVLYISDIEYNLSDFSFAERKEILDKVPAGALEQVLNYIVNIKQFIEKNLTCKLDENTTEVIQINGAFFATI